MTAFIIIQTRQVQVDAESSLDALTKAQEAFESPGDPAEGMSRGVHGMPAVTETKIHRIAPLMPTPPHDNVQPC